MNRNYISKVKPENETSQDIIRCRKNTQNTKNKDLTLAP